MSKKSTKLSSQNHLYLQKKHLRKQFINLRNNLFSTLEEKFLTEKKALKYISFLKDESGFFGSYCPIHSEFNPLALEQMYSHLKWVYPKIKDSLLEFHQRLDPQNIWKENKWGIKEPSDTASQVIPLSDIRAIFCPALTVDLNGHRLGYGKGYYDRTLCKFKGTKIALIFSQQIYLKDLPHEENDVLMDWILTEKELTSVSLKVN